jgi:hypothetical protein
MYRRVEIYDYDNPKIINIRRFSKRQDNDEESKDTLEFSYDTSDSLICINTAYPNGYNEIIYSTLKINYRELRRRLYREIENSVSNFLYEHRDEKFTALALDCYTENREISFSFDTDINRVDLLFPAEWKYCNFDAIDIINAPLDNAQLRKVRLIIAELAITLSKAPFFKNLLTYDKFKFLVFDHNALMADYSTKLKKILSAELFIP